MLSIKYIRENTSRIQNTISMKKADVDVQFLLELDSKRRNCLTEVELLRAERNTVSKTIAEFKKERQNF